MKYGCTCICLALLYLNILTGQIKSGPMLGAVEFRTAKIWYELDREIPLELVYWKLDKPEERKKIEVHAYDRFEFKIRSFYITGLDVGTGYAYQLYRKDLHRALGSEGHFRTQDLWNYRTPAPDFCFLAGSCAYLNEPEYDRPGRPYGGDSSIFETMAKEKAAFMLWLGDNWYMREVDFHSEWGIWYRASHDRSNPILRHLLKAMSHYAIWDDHDYGPNNEGISYVFKKEATDVFRHYWTNPPTPSDGFGTYTSFRYNDVDFFLLDGRSFRYSDELQDSIGSEINREKTMFGKEQMEWLKNQLANSKAPFKIIASGSTVLNLFNRYDCLVHYPSEYGELIRFIENEHINGVLFLSGDRHHSDVIKKNLNGGYTTYDITNSPLTSGIHKVSAYEKSNPDLLADMLVEQQNYSRICVSGPPNDRKFHLEFMDISGKSLCSLEIKETDLRFPK